MKSMKSIQLLFIALVFLPMVASADDSCTCGDNVTYTYVESTQTLTISGTGSMANYSVNGFAPWYSYSSKIIKAIIEDGVTRIGDYVFQDCSSLTSVTIPNSVTSLGSFAFHDCRSLTSVTIPNSVTSIGSNAFYYCNSLTSVTIPNSVKSIGINAFKNCI